MVFLDDWSMFAVPATNPLLAGPEPSEEPLAVPRLPNWVLPPGAPMAFYPYLEFDLTFDEFNLFWAPSTGARKKQANTINVDELQGSA
jgi:hypothetical protein